jgi:pimeloyl-ACP methyl ester carboxylesterase
MNMSTLKQTEQNLKIAEHNMEMAQYWANYLQSSFKLSKEFFEEVASFQKKQSSRVLDFVEKEASFLPGPLIMDEFQKYSVDFIQSSVIFWDVLRKRGNQYIEYAKAGSPPVLIYDYKVIMDGRELEHPVNYTLIEITPPTGITIDANKRPFLIVDPRAGHGAGIGGFKEDSQVGVALRAGHPVYFVIFYPEPEPTQTLRDIAVAEKKFVETISHRHPHSPKLCIIGNCQGGWAVMALAAAKPDMAGALVINSAPISYWAGKNGKNSLRYVGGLLGGSWLAQMASDFGNERFDGANLVTMFEDLTPEKNFWKKYYNLFSNVDVEENRFLNFERWWGGFFLLNEDEVRSIVDNLFIGNYLSNGRVQLNRSNYLDLRKIKSPIIVFCSEGDEITSPQQALNWIADVYDSEFDIKAEEQTIIYLVHATVGHLGIFASAKVAIKEHKEIVDLLNYVELLPPGLYEMIIKDNPHPVEGESIHQVMLEERTLKDIVDKQQLEYKKEHDIFRTMRMVSKSNSMLYDLYCRPIVRGMVNEQMADQIRQLHPLRTSRYLISDMNPFMTALSTVAEQMREQRKPADKNNLFSLMQNDFSVLIDSLFHNFKYRRDTINEFLFYSIYGNLSAVLSNILSSDVKLRDMEFEGVHDQLVDKIDEAMMQGDPVDAIFRILVFIINSQGVIDLSHVPKGKEFLYNIFSKKGWELPDLIKKLHVQTMIVANNNKRAFASLPKLMPNKADREFVLETLKAYFRHIPLETQQAKDCWAVTKKMIEELE